MDTSTTTLPFSEGGETSDLVGTWNLAGTRLTFDVTDRIRSGTTYRLDASSIRDVTGRPLDVAHAYLGDGALDFTTTDPGGENCRDALTVADATGTTVGGGLVWELPALMVVDDDGGLTCDGDGIPADAVIHYRKTTPAGDTAGGSWLHVRAFDLDGGSALGTRIDLEVYHDDCEPEGPDADTARQTCVTDSSVWSAYLPAPPGDYYIWVAHERGASFEPITVEIEEIAAPPEGDASRSPRAAR